MLFASHSFVLFSGRKSSSPMERYIRINHDERKDRNSYHLTFKELTLEIVRKMMMKVVKSCKCLKGIILM